MEHLTEIQDIKSIRIDVAKFREARGNISQSEAARRLGVLRQTLFKYENGIASVKAEMFARICILYKKPIDFYLAP